MSYFAGDIPAEDLVIEPARNGEPIDLTQFTIALAVLRDDTGAAVVGADLFATIAVDHVVIEWGITSPFATAGVYYVELTLENAGQTVLERVAPIPIVVEGVDDGWLTLDAARTSWPNFEQLADLQLFEVLWTAKQQCIAYAPALAVDQRPPLNYKAAQQMQARNIWNASKVDPGSGGIGDDSFVIRPFPLDWMVKQMLRPKTAVPAVG